MSLSSRSLAGSRAFTAGPSSSRKAVKVSNGAKWFMRRKDSFMVEVCVVCARMRGFPLAIVGRRSGAACHSRCGRQKATHSDPLDCCLDWGQLLLLGSSAEQARRPLSLTSIGGCALFSLRSL